MADQNTAKSDSTPAGQPEQTTEKSSGFQAPQSGGQEQPKDQERLIAAMQVAVRCRSPWH
jgi:hypothetical protein